jgi:Tfp pilus assembly protein PilF
MNDPEIRNLIDQAIAALHNGDFIRAVGIGDQLASLGPESAVVCSIRAQALLGADSPEESLQEARKAVALAPHDEHAHQLLAYASWRNDRLTLAQDSFEKAIELSNHRPSVLSDYAWFMASERGPKPGELAAKAAVEANADSSTAWAALGLAQYRLHRRHEAETSLRRALQLNPNDIYAQSAMVVLLQDLREDDQAEALADLLKEHSGTEDLIENVRQEAKKRKVARMLLERKTELDGPTSEPKSYRWIWLLGAAAPIALLSFLIDPRFPFVVIGVTLFLLIALRKWLD